MRLAAPRRRHHVAAVVLSGGGSGRRRRATTHRHHPDEVGVCRSPRPLQAWLVLGAAKEVLEKYAAERQQLELISLEQRAPAKSAR